MNGIFVLFIPQYNVYMQVIIDIILLQKKK